MATTRSGRYHFEEAKSKLSMSRYDPMLNVDGAAPNRVSVVVGVVRCRV